MRNGRTVHIIDGASGEKKETYPLPYPMPMTASLLRIYPATTGQPILF